MSLVALSVLAAWCAVLSVIDIRYQRLPNVLTGCGAVAVFGYACWTTQFAMAIVGAVLLAAPYLVVHLVAPVALGAGDVKLAVGLGAAATFGGAQAWVWAALAAPVVTAGVGVVLLSLRRLRQRRIRERADGDIDRGHMVPHGPSMCLATVLALVAAPP